MSHERVTRAQSLLGTLGVDGILVTNGTNRRYITGFTGEDHAADELSGEVLITANGVYLFEPKTNLPWAQAEAYEGVEVLPQERRWTDTVANVIIEQGLRTVGFEDATTTVQVYNNLVEALDGKGVELRPVGDAVDSLRAVKDDDEVALLQRALQMTDEAFVAAERRMRVGMTEKQVADIIREELRNAGSEGEAFDTIVASGPNAAKPHHSPGDRVIEEGEPIIIDMGALHQGYAGDLTRTVWFGQPSEQLVTIYRIVQEAHDACIANAAPGMTGVELDAVARDIFAKHELDQYFVHSLGHGLGLRVHEAPSASSRSTDTLEPGHVVTIEPGLYFPDWGGVRIENVVVITADGARNMTTAPKRAIDESLTGELS
ncbi:MAG TPA: Xaa-Pro peptidase family protein [Thermomicrobiales bacterium]|nr:Xaa-Pro peptidase family protein [Thermomicrobiales bacterium]